MSHSPVFIIGMIVPSTENLTFVLNSMNHLIFFCKSQVFVIVFVIGTNGESKACQNNWQETGSDYDCCLLAENFQIMSRSWQCLLLTPKLLLLAVNEKCIIEKVLFINVHDVMDGLIFVSKTPFTIKNI